MKKLIKIATATTSLLIVFSIISAMLITTFAATKTSSVYGLDYLVAQNKADNVLNAADMWTALSMRTSSEKDNYNYRSLLPTVDVSSVKIDVTSPAKRETTVALLSKSIINLILLGKDPTNVAGNSAVGTNLVSALENLQQTDGSFCNNESVVNAIAIWAIYLAQQKYAYTPTFDKTTAKAYIESTRCSDSGFAWSGNKTDASDVGTTSEIMIAQTLLGDSANALTTYNYIAASIDSSGFVNESFGKSSTSQAYAVVSLYIFKNLFSSSVPTTLSNKLTLAETGLTKFQILKSGYNMDAGSKTAADFYSSKNCVWAQNIVDSNSNFMFLFGSNKYTPLVAPATNSVVSASSKKQTITASSNNLSATATVSPKTGKQIAVGIIIVLIIAGLALAAVIIIPKIINKKK